MGKRPLTPKQARFVEEYLVDLNATQAAIRAGYSNRSAKVTAARLLTNANVAAAVQRGRAKLSRKLEVTQGRVLQELARIAFADIRDLFMWDEERACYVPSRDLTDDQAAAISAVEAETIRAVNSAGVTVTTIKLKLKTYDKLGALEKIAKHLGMFIERHEHTGAGGGPIEVAELTDADLVERARAQASRIALVQRHRNGNGNGNGRH